MPWSWPTSLRGRLLSIMGLAMTAFLGAMAINLAQLRAIGDSLAVVNTVYLPLTATGSRILGQLDLEPSGSATIVAILADAQETVARGGALATDAEERLALEAARVQVDRLEAQWRAFTRNPSEAERAGLRAEVLQLNALVSGRIDAVSAKTVVAQAWAERLGLALIAVALVVAGWVLVLVGRSLRPLETLAEDVRRVGAGETQGVVPLPGDDEMAHLSRDFAWMVATLSERDQNLQSLTLYLRRVLDAIGAAVVVVEDGRCRMVNPAAQALWGVEPGVLLPAALADLAEGRSERPVGDRSEEIVRRPFGEAGWIVVGEDVTERKRDRDRLQRSERLALVGQMLAQVTHEVRNPLNAMSLHAELLADEVESPEGRKLLEVVSGEIRRLESVTERYLDLARRRPPETAPEDPLALARGVIALEEESLRRQGVRVTAEGDVGPALDLDGNTVRRALLNLLRNAADAGARVVEVRIRRRPGTVEFDVADDGPGMTPEVAARVFEPFFSTRARGTGLGLAITRQSVEDLGGTVAVHTGPGEGTRFTLTVPCDISSPA